MYDKAKITWFNESEEKRLAYLYLVGYIIWNYNFKICFSRSGKVDNKIYINKLALHQRNIFFLHFCLLGKAESRLFSHAKPKLKSPYQPQCQQSHISFIRYTTSRIQQVIFQIYRLIYYLFIFKCVWYVYICTYALRHVFLFYVDIFIRIQLVTFVGPYRYWYV